MIALDRIGLLGWLDLAGQQPDFGYEMLRAGVMAAGEMDIHRLIQCHARFAPGCDFLGVALGIRGREFAPVLPVQAISPARIALVSVARPSALMLRLRGFESFSRDAGNQQVLPDREPDIAVAEFL